MEGEGGLSGGGGGELDVAETASGLVALGWPAGVEDGAVLLEGGEVSRCSAKSERM